MLEDEDVSSVSYLLPLNEGKNLTRKDEERRQPQNATQRKVRRGGTKQAPPDTIAEGEMKWISIWGGNEYKKNV